MWTRAVGHQVAADHQNAVRVSGCHELQQQQLSSSTRLNFLQQPRRNTLLGFCGSNRGWTSSNGACQSGQNSFRSSANSEQVRTSEGRGESRLTYLTHQRTAAEKPITSSEVHPNAGINLHRLQNTRSRTGASRISEYQQRQSGVPSDPLAASAAPHDGRSGRSG